MGLASLGLVGGWEFVDLIFGVGVLWGCVFGDLAGNGGDFGFGFPGGILSERKRMKLPKRV